MKSAHTSACVPFPPSFPPARTLPPSVTCPLARTLSRSPCLSPSRRAAQASRRGACSHHTLSQYHTSLSVGVRRECCPPGRTAPETLSCAQHSIPCVSPGPVHPMSVLGTHYLMSAPDTAHDPRAHEGRYRMLCCTADTSACLPCPPPPPPPAPLLRPASNAYSGSLPTLLPLSPSSASI
eukprot:3937711-Rhodomonas_salina.1